MPAIAGIYAEAAANSHATFDVEGQPAEWWAKVPEREVLLVALEDGEVLGFAKSGRFKDRPGYNSTRETSAYVHADHRGKGVGNALYTELLARLEADGDLLMAVAGIAPPNPASEALHAAHGFTEVGVFEDVGVKFGQPWSVRWYQRRLTGGASSCLLGRRRLDLHRDADAGAALGVAVEGGQQQRQSLPALECPQPPLGEAQLRGARVAPGDRVAQAAPDALHAHDAAASGAELRRPALRARQAHRHHAEAAHTRACETRPQRARPRGAGGRQRVLVLALAVLARVEQSVLEARVGVGVVARPDLRCGAGSLDPLVGDRAQHAVVQAGLPVLAAGEHEPAVLPGAHDDEVLRGEHRDELAEQAGEAVQVGRQAGEVALVGGGALGDARPDARPPGVEPDQPAVAAVGASRRDRLLHEVRIEQPPAAPPAAAAHQLAEAPEVVGPHVHAVEAPM